MLFSIRRRLDLEDALRLDRIHYVLRDIINNPGSLTQMVILFNLLDGLNENHGMFHEEPYINPYIEKFDTLFDGVEARFDRLEEMINALIAQKRAQQISKHNNSESNNYGQ